MERMPEGYDQYSYIAQETNKFRKFQLKILAFAVDRGYVANDLMRWAPS